MIMRYDWIWQLVLQKTWLLVCSQHGYVAFLDSYTSALKLADL